MDGVTLEVYLFFDRNCGEAMKFYQGVFGGELTTTTRGSVDPEAPEDMKDLLIHADLTGGLVHLMGSDSVGVGSDGQSRMAVSLSGGDEERLRQVFDDLAAGGTVNHPLEKAFWGDTHGNVTDKFGISWMMTITAKK